ncbi:MAG TPA: DUF721 domain-containing protein [Candidatus Cloacimonadota bacterium]|jgi:hypothetical protein|nr:DUF721 domain-containing protein [Candidatus Cloacimonadales bacterium]HPY97015.1 DUF721 domain-containing protein [Candidatus Cloacimonadota bacterium]HQB41587.1 DUF721 domain-containing protein [Candidatus Cloacimonadota bacterium]
MKNLCSSAYQLVYDIARRSGLYEFAHITLTWSSIVGKIMAERSSIVKLDHSTLFVKTANHAWMQEFVLNKDHILQLFHEKDINFVKDIVFFV